MKLLALADDTTGALETGTQLRAAGWDALVSFDGWPAASTPALVLDTRSRLLPDFEARTQLGKILETAQLAGPTRLFKKTDSTLRGPIAGEFDALLTAFPHHHVVYAPAYPRLGRTLVNGMLLIHGIPVHQTPIAADPQNPIVSSHVPSLLRAGLDRPVLHARTADPLPDVPPGAVLIVDSGSEETQRRIAAHCAADPKCLLAGPASLAGYWAAAIDNPHPMPPTAAPFASKLLVLCGSLHPASERQVQEAKRAGLCVFQVRPGGGSSLSMAGGVAYAIQRQHIALVMPARTEFSSPAAAASELAQIADAVRHQTPVEALVMFGGETSGTVLQTLDIPFAQPWSDVLPGVPVSRIHWDGKTRWLVTKAGAFGEPGLLADLYQRLTPAQA